MMIGGGGTMVVDGLFEGACVYSQNLGLNKKADIDNSASSAADRYAHRNIL